MFTIVCPHCKFSKKVASERLPKETGTIKCPVCKLSFPFDRKRIPQETASVQAPESLQAHEVFKLSSGGDTPLNKRLIIAVGLLIVCVGAYAFLNCSTFFNEPVPAPVVKKVEKKDVKKVEKKVVEKVEEPEVEKVDLYPTVAVASKWGKHLNPGALAPNNMFKVFYINTQNPQNLIATDYSPAVSISYSYNDLHGIPSEDFGAYWVGNIEFEKETNREIAVAQGHAETKIYIDGKELFGQDNKKSFMHTFSKGVHTVEVEHVNNWHTTDLLVSILPFVPVSSVTEVTVAINDVVRGRKVKYWFASVHESPRMDHQVVVDLKDSDIPVVLFLSSYDPISWIVNNAEKAQLNMIVYSSYSPGSSISMEKTIPVLKMRRQDLTSSMYLVPECSESRNQLRCSGEEEFPRLLKQIDRITEGERLDGFTGTYDSGSISVPDVVLDRARYENLQKQRDAIKRRQKRLADQSIDTVFK